MSKFSFPPIEVINIGEHISWFYWGRVPDHVNVDQRLGGGAHAIHDGNCALLIDTMNLPGQAEWVRDYLEQTLKITSFQVINTHWHPDHIFGNSVFSDSPIFAHPETRVVLERERERLERGYWDGCPPMKGSFVLPNQEVKNGDKLKVGKLEVEVVEFGIHCPGHVAIYLEKEKTIITGDILEDPICIFNLDFSSPDSQLKEFERLGSHPATCYLSTHCSPSHVKEKGGYDVSFVHHNAKYLQQMLTDTLFQETNVKEYLKGGLEEGELEWCESYQEVHQENVKRVKKYLEKPQERD